MGTSSSSSRPGDGSPARLLAHVGARLAAAVDQERAASFVTNALVPELADAAALVVVDPKGQSRQLAIHSAGPDAARLLDAGKGCHPNALNDESEPHIASIGFPASEKGARHSAGSCMVTALRSDDRVRDVLVLVRTGEKPFTADDRETAAAVASMFAGLLDRVGWGDPAEPAHARGVSETSFARVFDLSPLVLSVTDLETGRFIAVNEAFVQISGYSREEIIGRTPAELGLWVAPEERDRGLAEIRTGAVIRSREMRFRTKDGTIRDFLLSGAMIEFDGRQGVLSALTDVTERKQAERLLARYQLLARNSRDILLFVREDGTIVEANAAAAVSYGYTLDELLSLRIADLRAPETLGVYPQQFGEALEGGIRFETRHRRKNGSTFPVEVAAQAADVAGERLVLSIIRDVTARVEAETARRASEERLRLALDAAGMGTWEIDVATGRRTAGGYHESLLGASPDSLDGILELIHPDDRDRVRQGAIDAFERGAEYNQEFRLQRTGGDVRWIASHGHAIEGDGGRKLMGVSYDVTGRKLAESRLRASEQHFRALAETMPQLIWTCAPDGACEFLSRQWFEYTGKPEHEQLGFGWLDSVHPDDRAGLQTAWQEAVESGAMFDTEFRIRRHDGAYRWFKTRAAPVRDDDGSILKWYGSNTDIDDLKLAEERRRTLIDTLAHDLKNPLAAIKAQAQVLRRRMARGQPIELDQFDVLAETATNMADLIDEMSDASKLAAGRQLELDPAEVDLISLLQQIVATYAATSQRHTIELETGGATMTGRWDRTRLERVFGNLLSNAIKYSPFGGEIAVTVARELGDKSDWAAVSFSDHGIGIPASDLERIFERHHRASNVGRIRGNGLGLAGAADVIRLHGGSISVASNEGAGSTFTVRLPLSPTDEHESASG